MTDDEQGALVAAIDRLDRFRASWEPGDMICEDTKLTGEDLALLVARLRETQDVVMIREIDMADVARLHAERQL